jgi:putative DNA primase/helicase
VTDSVLTRCARETHDDIGNAARLLIRHGENVRYVHALGQWFVWDGIRYRADDTGVVSELAKDSMVAIWDEATTTSDVREKADISNHARQSGKEPRIRAAVTVASTDRAVAIRPSDLDRDPFVIGVQNGAIELATGQYRQAKRDDLLTMQCGVSWDENAKSELWCQFLDRVLGGNSSLISFVQRAVGYTLTGLTTEQVLFFCFGLGRNGKSVFLSMMRALFGDYAAQASFDSVLERKSEGPRSDLARLTGKRFVSALEVGEGRRLDEGMVKLLTGQDVLTCRPLYKSEFEYLPRFKLWLAANHKPTIRGQDLAIWRRIHMIPFSVTIPEEERDPNLIEKLRAELPALLKWAVQGCLEWQRIGLKPPAEVVRATEAYRVESDVIGKFLEERCELDPSALTPSKELIAAYRLWAEETGEIKLSQTMLGRRLGERGFDVRNAGPRNTAHRVGVRLLDRVSREGLRGLEPSFPKSSHVRASGDFRATASNPPKPSGVKAPLASESLSPNADADRVTLTPEQEAAYLARMSAA